jgi:hypothetical protein
MIREGIDRIISAMNHIKMRDRNSSPHHTLKKAATDTELALLYAIHIDNPCVDHQTGLNIREFYIREAESMLPQFTNPEAKLFLEGKIREYRGK